MATNECFTFSKVPTPQEPKHQIVWCHIRTFIEGSYSSVEVQLVYSTAPTNWVNMIWLFSQINLIIRIKYGDTDYIDIVAGMLQGPLLVLYLCIICLVYVLRTFIDLMKENGFKLAKKRSRKYAARKNTDEDYANDIKFLANISARAKTLTVNADKMEYMCFNQRGNISTL